MNKKIAAIMLVGVLSMTLLSGCGDKGPTKEDLISENETLNSMLADSEEQVESLKNAVSALRGEEGPVEAITSVSDGSGQQSFNSIGGKILFPQELKYTGASQAPNTSKMSLSDRISIVPSDNWIVQINGTTTKYSHPSGVYGVIKIATIPETTRAENIEETILKPFTDAIPHTSITNGKIFLEDVWRGMHTTMTILNNEKPALIKCGVVGYADVSMSYSFYYDGDPDNTKTELINSLLKTVSFNTQKMRIE